MRLLVALLGLAVLLLGAPCAAQPTATHRVRLSIPHVLRLRIDDGASRAIGNVPLAIEVVAAAVRLDPAHTRLQVLANTRWQLTASFAPSAGSEGLELGYFVDGGPTTWTRSSFAAVILQGGPTGGWREETVRYGVASVPPDGNYGGLITFTLTRP